MLLGVPVVINYKPETVPDSKVDSYKRNWPLGVFGLTFLIQMFAHSREYRCYKYVHTNTYTKHTEFGGGSSLYTYV